MAPTPTPTPIPTAPSRPYLTRDPPDIENLARVIVSLTISEISFLPKKKAHKLVHNETFALSAGAQPADEGVHECRADDGDEEEQEALEEE